MAGTNVKIYAVAAVAMLLTAGVLLFPWSEDDDDGPKYNPTMELGDEYIIVAEIPSDEEERIMTVGLSAMAVRGELDAPHYNPIFYVDSDGLDGHQLWTIEMLGYSDVPAYVFSDSEALNTTVAGQLEGSGVSSVTGFPYSTDVLLDVKGFEAPVTALTYEEALWLAPLARLDNLIVVPGPQTVRAQQDVWDSLFNRGLPASYVVVANPRDWMDLYTEFDGQNSSYHIKDLALVAPALAMYRNGYVITDPPMIAAVPSEWSGMVPENDTDLNRWSMSLLALLQNMSYLYGPIDNIALVGSAEAVPQFELPDHSASEPDYTSSDSVYGFLDENNEDMDAGVGRIVNFNVQGASNQLVRTFRYDDLAETVTVQFENGESVTREWRRHGVDANGFEVADMRGQNTPGIFASRDYDDEAYTFDYISTIGVGIHGEPTFMPFEGDVEGYVQTASHLLYRGHGSWHGTLYTWGYYGPDMGYGERMIEGDRARELFVPPQVTLLFSCENTKIHGLNFGGDPIEMDRVFATSWMYAGAVALIGATEVSYSNIGQDIYGLSGEVTGDHNWDLNNLWFASTAKYTLDDEYNIGEVLRLSENRYLAKHPGINPFEEPADPANDGAHWKTVAMYCLYGDPAFQYHVTSPGENAYMPWD
ncbi:MAG: C25 family cysteine peptidase [Thermoplasmata archaeon]|nr:C25 family cysteine peptidase [Thermoplasmata archaeon]